MPLLNGTFDPTRFNSTTLAEAMYEVSEDDSPVAQEDIDFAQAVIDNLVAKSIFNI